jgi:anti-sigma regulatory factor (Ser/Thr protein kinase)
MTSSTSQGRDATSTLDFLTSPLIGHLYWDVRGGKLFRLNEAARHLHEDGIPLLGSEPGLEDWRTLAGKAVGAAELPLQVAWREGRPAELSLLLCRANRPPCQLHHSASPLCVGTGEVTAVMATVCRTPAPPDWHALAGLAHDLRTPLQTMRFLLAALKHPSLPATEQEEIQERLHGAVERALQIGSDLLDWCRVPGAGGRAVAPAWTPLKPLLESLVQEQVPAATAKRLVLSSELAEVAGWQIYTDPVRLGRALMNLLVNAIRYTPQGGRVTLAVAWQEQASERMLMLGVTDTGTGIAPEEHESIFQPFERGRSSRGDSSGSGLGLSVVDQLVDELGLRREFTSEHGRGTIFRVLVPQRLLRFAPSLAVRPTGQPSTLGSPASKP